MDWNLAPGRLPSHPPTASSDQVTATASSHSSSTLLPPPHPQSFPQSDLLTPPSETLSVTLFDQSHQLLDSLEATPTSEADYVDCELLN